jgi:hypothetical protein
LGAGRRKLILRHVFLPAKALKVGVYPDLRANYSEMVAGWGYLQSPNSVDGLFIPRPAVVEIL